MHDGEVRHPYLIEPGEGVMLSDSLIVYRDRVRAFLEDTGIPQADLVVAPVSSIPIPVTSASGGKRNRPQVHPEMAWFPLFWLPLEVGLRMYVRDRDDVPPRIETNEEWSVRIMITSAAAGLFDPETGTWLDALATVGLDSSDEAVHDRVRAWQQGASDRDLDSIDFSPRFQALDISPAELIPEAHQLTEIQWALSAGEIKMACRGILQMGLSERDLLTTADAWLFLALTVFSSGPWLPRGGRTGDALRQLIAEFDGAGLHPSGALSGLHQLASDVYQSHGHVLETSSLLQSL